MRKLILLFTFMWLVGCQNVKDGSDLPETVDTASEQALMDYYRGLHLVGVRLLSENAGSGGRANLERFYELYFSDKKSEALTYLRMSLFADPFNDDNKAVAAQLESTNLFGLLNSAEDQQNATTVQLRSGETLRQVSRRIYGTEHLAVMLDRYNTHLNPNFQSSGQVLAPPKARLSYLEDYLQPKPMAPVRQATVNENANQTLS